VAGIANKIVEFVMALKKTDSVSSRLFRIFFAFALAGAIILTVITVYSETTRLRSDIENKGRTLTTLLADNVRIGVFAENREQLNEAIVGVMGHKETMAVFVYTADGRELIRKARPEYAAGNAVARFTSAPESVSRMVTHENLIELVEPVTLDDTPVSEETIFFSGTAPEGGKRVIGCVRMLFDTSSLTERISAILLRNIAIGCLLFIFGAMTIFYVLDRSLRPLQRLRDEVEMLGAGKEIEKISIQSADEVGRLATAFNEMADNLKKREQEAKELEQQLRHVEKMEAVGTLARGIAHDFNNIMTAVEGSMFALKKKIGSSNPLYKYIYHMENSLSRSKVLIQGLLVFSRGHLPTQARVEVNEIVWNLVPVISSLIGDNIKCESRYFDSPLIVTADRFQIEQVILNLAVNARDAMPDGGVIDIRTDLVLVEDPEKAEVVLPAPGWYAVISVGDSGVGISRGVMERIFEPFYTTKEVGKGTGLGLSIVYGIIEEHKGGVAVCPKENKGTEFRVYLPVPEKMDDQ
jgi:signal transduction histidine kinase